ncbi:hypothetical protein GGS20DRAFT_546508 [Poronia punctata]|nr:hypothetical protein GGS20DRAFT_546508 [Poronia punctata]
MFVSSVNEGLGRYRGLGLGFRIIACLIFPCFPFILYDLVERIIDSCVYIYIERERSTYLLSIFFFSSFHPVFYQQYLLTLRSRTQQIRLNPPKKTLTPILTTPTQLNSNQLNTRKEEENASPPNPHHLPPRRRRRHRNRSPFEQQGYR